MPKATKKKILPKKQTIEKETPKSVERYLGAIGRRKTSVARVRLLIRGDKEILVNGRASARSAGDYSGAIKVDELFG